MNRSMMWVLVGAAALTLGACASREPAAHEFYCAAQAGGVAVNVELVNSKRMARRISVHCPTISATATGTLRVSTTIENRRKDGISLEARTVFRAAGGAQAESPSGWEQIRLNPNSTHVYEALSMTTQVKQVIVEVREGNIRANQ